MARHVVALHGMVLLALPNTTVDAASSDASVLIQDLVHSRRVHNEAVHPNSSSASLHTSFDRDGCPAPKGYDQAHHQACSQAALQQVNICGSSALMRERDEPRPRKKVYWLRHALPDCCEDCGLQLQGIQACDGLRVNSTMLRKGPRSVEHRAEVIYTSPATRTMETALRVFGDLNVSFVVDRNLVETCCYKPHPELVQAMLTRMGRLDLLFKYNALFLDAGMPVEAWVHGAEVRLKRFTRQLLQRPEERIVVVTHHMLMNTLGLGMNCMEMGETIMETELDASGRWYQLTESSCGGRRRRWMYGNLQKKVD